MAAQDGFEFPVMSDTWLTARGVY